MTLLDDRPTTPAGPAVERARATRSATPRSSWAFASRLARREVRRRPGRTMLVMLLIAVPVIGMGTASVASRTLSGTNRDWFTEQYGQADIVSYSDDGADPAALDAVLPDGTTRLEVFSLGSEVYLDGPNGIESLNVRLTDLDLAAPIAAGIFDIESGRAPIGAKEMLVTRSIADELNIGVGDELRLVRPDLERTVVGIGRERSSFSSEVLVVPGFDRGILRPGAGSTQVLLDLPDRLTESEIDEIASAGSEPGAGGHLMSRTPQFPETVVEVSRQQLAWGWVAGMVGFVAVGIVVAAAFATSARRQLVTIGHLSANGAPERLVRRTIGLQGAWTGVLGAIFGVGVTVGIAVTADRMGWLDRLADRVVGDVRIESFDFAVISVSAVLAATVAALIPARSAARIPVLTALAGRRPVGQPPTWMARVGVASSIVGLLMLASAAASDSPGDLEAAVALVGVLGVLLGLVCASPLIVAAVGRIGGRSSGVVRLASRSIDRSRVRSAAVMTAIATVGALATAGATSVGLAENSERANQWTPDLQFVTLDYVHDYYQFLDAEIAVGESAGVFDPPPERPTPLPNTTKAGLEALLPDAVWTPISRVVVDPLPINVFTFEEANVPTEIVDRRRLNTVTVYDENVRARVQIVAEAQKILDEDGIVSTSRWGSDDAWILTEGGPVNLSLRDLAPSVGALSASEARSDATSGESSTVDFDTIYVGENRRWLGDALVTKEFAEANGLDVAVPTYWLENPTDLTDSERDALNDFRSLGRNDAFIPSATAPGFDVGEGLGFEGWQPYADQPQSTTPWSLIKLAVAAASLLFVLLVVAIGLSLSATESRDERNVLHAVGASPATLRRVAAAKAWVLTTGAAVVAVPAGYVVAFVVARATDSIGSAPFPFLVAGALLIAIPAIAAAVTWIVSALAQRVRPAAMSTFASD